MVSGATVCCLAAGAIYLGWNLDDIIQRGKECLGCGVASENPNSSSGSHHAASENPNSSQGSHHVQCSQWNVQTPWHGSSASGSTSNQIYDNDVHGLCHDQAMSSASDVKDAALNNVNKASETVGKVHETVGGVHETVAVSASGFQSSEGGGILRRRRGPCEEAQSGFQIQNNISGVAQRDLIQNNISDVTQLDPIPSTTPGPYRKRQNFACQRETASQMETGTGPVIRMEEAERKIPVNRMEQVGSVKPAQESMTRMSTMTRMSPAVEPNHRHQDFGDQDFGKRVNDDQVNDYDQVNDDLASSLQQLRLDSSANTATVDEFNGKTVAAEVYPINADTVTAEDHLMSPNTLTAEEDHLMSPNTLTAEEDHLMSPNTETAEEDRPMLPNTETAEVYYPTNADNIVRANDLTDTNDLTNSITIQCEQFGGSSVYSSSSGIFSVSVPKIDSAVANSAGEIQIQTAGANSADASNYAPASNYMKSAYIKISDLRDAIIAKVTSDRRTYQGPSSDRQTILSRQVSRQERRDIERDLDFQRDTDVRLWFHRPGFSGVRPGFSASDKSTNLGEIAIEIEKDIIQTTEKDIIQTPENSAPNTKSVNFFDETSPLSYKVHFVIMEKEGIWECSDFEESDGRQESGGREENLEESDERQRSSRENGILHSKKKFSIQLKNPESIVNGKSGYGLISELTDKILSEEVGFFSRKQRETEKQMRENYHRQSRNIEFSATGRGWKPKPLDPFETKIVLLGKDGRNLNVDRYRSSLNVDHDYSRYHDHSPRYHDNNPRYHDPRFDFYTPAVQTIKVFRYTTAHEISVAKCERL